MLSPRSFAVAIILAAIPVCLFAQPPVDSPPSFFVHHKQASSEQGLDQKYGSSVALTNGVLVAADENEHVEVLRQAADGTWALEATIPSPESGIAFGAREALATNGDWIAVGAKLDDTFGANSGAVHMYKFDGADWDYRGALSHMAPFGSIVTDQFGMALAMDGDRMVVGSRAENGAGAAGAVHYFQYNGMLDMWIESGFIASEHTSGNSTSKFAESVDISGDYMIVGEHRNNTNGNFAGAAHIYSFYNQCWHLQNVFYGHNADDILGKDVAISGTVAIAGSPFADTDGLNEAGAVTVYELVPFSGDESAWAETAHFAPEGTAAGDWVGSALDIDGSLIAVGVPRDDAFPINGGAGYFLFDCSAGALTCVSEGYACDAMQNDRLGFDVAVSNGLAAIGATLDDNIYDDAGSVYILGAEDVGFECDLTAPGASAVDLVDVDDTGLSNQDDLTRHTTPDFDVFLPGGGTFSVIEGFLAEAGDALIWYMEGTGDSTIHILTQEDIDAGVVPITFIYPGPVLTDGEYSFCSYVMDEFGNIGETNCLPIVIDNADPVASGAFNSPVLAFADTTLYLDADGEAELLVYPLTNLTATDNIGIDTLFVDLEEYDCSNLNVPVTVTLTAIDLAGNIGTTEFTASVLDITGPVMSVQDLTVYLDESGNVSVSPGEGDANTFDVCGDVEFSWEQAPECVGDIPRYPLTSGTYDDNTSECDDCTTEVGIGFDFNFYGEEYNSLWISSNGLLSFLSDDDYCCEGESLTDGSYEAVIAVIHTDIDPDECDDCGIYYSTQGEAPNREFVVSWHYVSNYEENEIRHDGQAVLYEGSNVIEVFNGGFSSYLPDGCDDPMTTGISNQDGTEGVGPYEQICDPVAPALFVFTPNTNGGYDMVQCTSDLHFNCSHVGENTVVLVATDESGNASQQELTITVLDEVGPSITQDEHILYLNALGEVEDEDLAGIYTANDICGMDTSYVTHTLSCDEAIGIDDQVFLVEAGEDMMLFVDHDQNLYGFNASTNAVTRIVGDFQGFNSADLMFSDGEGNIVFGEGDEEFIRVDVQTGAVSGEFYSDEDNGIMFDTGNGLGFEDLQSVETVGGVHYALSHDGDGYNVGTGTPLFSFELGSASPETNYYAPFTATLVRMLPYESPEGDDWDWTALAIDAEQQLAYAICDENGLDSGSNEKELWSIDMSSSSFVEASSCPECDVDAFVEYTKEDFAIGVADTITPYVALARGNRQGYFNAITQNSWNGAGPEGTYWKMGPTAQEGDYTSWVGAHDHCAECQLDDTISLWIPQGNFFFDIVTTSWTCCQEGGGFSYSRTLVDAPEYAIEVPTMDGIEHLGRISSAADAMIFYDGSLILGFENGNIGRVSFSDSGLEEEVLVANVASDDFGAVLSGFSPQFSSSIDVTAIDIHGNTSESQLSVLLVDTILPTILAQDTTLFLDGNGLASLTLEELAGDSYDNCGIESLTSDGLDFDCDSKGANPITITAVDNLGNVDSLTVTVTVLDLVLPTAVAQDITIYLDAAGAASIDSADLDNGSDHPCGGIVSMDLSQSEFDCSHVGANTVTLTVYDGSGNSATDDANVQVVDTISPSAIAQDLTVQLDASGAGSITAAQVDNGSSDACGIADLSLNQLTFDCTHVGTNSVTLTVTDNNGNLSVAQATITVLDGIDPVVLAQNVTVQLDANGAGSVTAAQIDNGSSDACGIASTLLEENGGTFVESLSFNCSHVGSNEVTILVTDVNGNESETVVTVTVEDNVNPTAMAQDLVVQLDASGAGSITAAQIDNGSSDACGIATTTLSQNSFDCSHVGANSVTLTVTDNNGNVSTDIATVTVEDNVDPVAIAQNITLQLDASGAASIAASQIDNGSSDACGIATITVSQESFDCSHVGANEITLTVTDNNGNVSTDIATVTVEDKVDPEAIAQDLTVELDASGAGSITAAQIDNGSSDACGIATMTVSQESFDCTHLGANTVTLTVTDNNGNESTATATITVEDNIAPTVSASGVTVYLDENGSGTLSVASTASGVTDNCSVASLTISIDGGAPAESVDFDCSRVGDGGTEAEILVTDGSGNSTSATAIIIALDTISPVVLTQNLTIQLDVNGAASITAEAVNNGSSDACGIENLALNQTDFDCSHVGTNTVTLAVTDVNGNLASATATVTVQDNVNPQAVAQDLTVQLDADGAGSITVDQVNNGSSDACGIATMTLSQENFDCSHVGANTVTLTVTDNNGNVSSATATVTVEDNVNPQAVAQDLTVQLDANGAGSITAEQMNDGSSDACGIASLALSQTDFDCSHVGANTVTLTVTDNNGNQSTTTATITVEDNVDPSISLGASDMTVECDGNGNSAQLQAWLTDNGGAEASDACGISWSHDFVALSDDCGNTGSSLVIFTVQDPNGNSVTTSATFTIEDKTNPSIDVDASNETVECDGAGNGVQLNAWLNSQGGAVASDICGGVVWTNNHSALSDDCGATGSTTVIFTATDDCGLTSTTTATFTIEDTTQPDIDSDPQDVVYQRDGNEAQAFSAWLTNFGGMTSTDVCGGTTQSHNSLGLTDECGSTGTETVTFTSTDDCNNTDTRDATFTVIDEVAPSCPLIDLIDASDSGADMTDNITNDDTPTMRVMFTGVFAQSAESGDVVEFYINSVLTESYTIDQTDVDNGYAEFETGSHPDGSVSFSARHIDGCDQASIFAFLNIIVHTTAPDAQAQDLTIALDENGQASIDADELDNGSSNDFGAVSFAATQTSFDCSDVGDNAVTLTVTDIAGNTATADATVTVEDNMAPMAESNDLDVYLDANGMASIAASDVDVNSYDNCAIDSMWLDQYDFDCTHVGLNEVQLTVLDVNGNSASALSGVTVLDTVSPAVTLQDIVVELDENGAVSIALDDVLVEATDACGIQSMVLDVDAFDCNTTGDNEVTVIATDVNGNSTVRTANVVVEDNEMPEVNIFDLENYTLYAGENCVNMVDLFAAGQPWYEATDNCAFDVDILYDEINEAGIEGCREFDRRWIIEAVDASGNVSRDTTLQHITVVDTTAPVVFLAGVPADVSLNLDADCNGDMPAAAAVTASATDNCTDAPVVGAVSYVDSAPAYLCGDAGSYTVLRTYMASATDNCGNAGMASATQTVTFLDVTAPQITSSNGISNGDVVAQSQGSSIFSWIDLDSPEDLTAEDACGGEVSLVQSETYTGMLPTDNIGNYCEGATPAAFLDGDACNGDNPAAMVLEGTYFDGAGFTVVDGGVNLIESYYDKTLFIQVEMENAEGTGGFIWSADYNAAYSWSQWSGLGRGYKKDCSNVMPGQSPWTDWSYLVMQTGGMIGTGIYAGSELSLTHQPMNYYYGLQVGQGANNQNAEYGASAWFYWSGQLVVNGASQGFMGSSGDIMLDMDCALPWSAQYDYVLTDPCGNSTAFGYSIQGETSSDVDPTVQGGEGHQPFDVSVSGDLKEPIRVTGLMPNPTNNVSQLGFVVSNNMRLRVDLYTMSGELIQELYDGNAMSDVEYLMTIDAEGLNAGMYQIRIASNTYMAVKKLLVTQ